MDFDIGDYVYLSDQPELGVGRIIDITPSEDWYIDPSWTQECLVFFPDWHNQKRGHASWYKHRHILDEFEIPYVEDSLYGSWFVGNYGLELAEGPKEISKNPYWKVCSKILKMNRKRKELNYGF